MTDKQIVTQERSGEQPLQTAVPMNRYQPAVDVYETAEELVLLADMPGVAQEGLQVEINKNLLTLEGEIAGSNGQARNSYYRQFRLADGFDGEAGEAELKDGVLRLRLPKVEAAKPKKIAVKTLH